jgi:DNA-binding NarL/FixJ family response regulator
MQRGKGKVDMLRIFILSSNSMFGVGLETVLSRQAGMVIVGQESDLEQAIGAIHTLHPDLVIAVSHKRADDPALAIARISEETQAKIIAINLESNAVRVYVEKQQEAKQVDDLVQAIEAEMMATQATQKIVNDPIAIPINDRANKSINGQARVPQEENNG